MYDPEKDDPDLAPVCPFCQSLRENCLCELCEACDHPITDHGLEGCEATRTVNGQDGVCGCLSFREFNLG